MNVKSENLQNLLVSTLGYKITRGLLIDSDCVMKMKDCRPINMTALMSS